jgi:formylglycine-generating enzyme required for sulfatase activity
MAWGIPMYARYRLSMRPVLRLLFLFGPLLCGWSAVGNNITVTQPMLVDFNSVAGTVDARFTVSWQNSWRVSTAPGNWDAAWVFLKFRVGTADPTRTGVSSTGTTLNVGSTALLRVGMPLVKTAGTGTLAANTVITAIPNGTQVTVSAAPTVALSGASVRFIRIWEHARLATDASHLAPAGSTIRTGLLNPAAAYNATTNYGVGAFIYRSANGTGTFTANNVELRWNLGTQGLSGGPIEVCAFGHEMVYVTAGSFRVGDGGSNVTFGRFYTQPNQSSTFFIATEAAITVGAANGNLNYSTSTFYQPGDGLGPIPAAFPKGTTPFYCMKYELTQADYVAFLNRLTRQQQDSRTATALPAATTAVTNRFVMSNSAASLNRNGVRCNAAVAANDPIAFYCDLNGNGIGNEAADGQWLACNHIRWSDLSAYLDWSGLRPMTELEFEKACRGPLTPVPNEYAWGTATIAATAYTITNAGTANEQVGTGYSAGGNAAYSTTVAALNGPVRVGIFPHHASNSGRTTSGAGYFGALNLSGNLSELTITVGRPMGRSFTGIHGNGVLTHSGMHDTVTWPTGPVGGYDRGWGERGGSAQDAAGWTTTSFRHEAAEGQADNATGFIGGRGVRTMP